MYSTTVNRPQYACSAFFETKDSLQRHLDENIEQERVRSPWPYGIITNAIPLAVSGAVDIIIRNRSAEISLPWKGNR